MVDRAVKYCGGCNSKYDRRAAVKLLERELGSPLPTAREGEAYGVVFTICGCSARCADVSRLCAERIIFLDETNFH